MCDRLLKKKDISATFSVLCPLYYQGHLSFLREFQSISSISPQKLKPAHSSDHKRGARVTVPQGDQELQE